jgi:stress-induced morphogen
MESLRKKVTRILREAFPPPDKIRLQDEDGVIGVVVSARFQGLDSMERLDLIDKTLDKKLTAEEKKGVLMIVAVTPTEEIAHTS